MADLALFLVLYVIFLLNFVCSKKCQWKVGQDAPEVFWINMDKSRQRRGNMEQLLNEIGFRHFRVRGLTPREIYIPDDIERTWRTAWCQLSSSWEPPLRSTLNISSELSQYTSYTSSLCGRGKKSNTAKELGCTTSHVLAMYRAIHSPTAKSRYALIVEDDVYFPFNVDYNALGAAAPKGFGIIQLFNSNARSMKRTWNQFVSSKELFVERHAVRAFDFWSTCAYMIDRVAMKPIIDAVLRQYKGWWEFKIVAGITYPCVPKECCPSANNVFNRTAPCVYAPQGYQADSFLYAMTNTLMFSVPIISNGLGGNQSTFHQDHVEMLHKNAFKQQRVFINEMLGGRVKPPEFMSPACDNLLDVDML